MKKIFTFCMAALAAMTMSAAVTNMTCAEAQSAALALQAGEDGTDTVAVTGYVTKTVGGISKGQQRFYIDDVKGSGAETVQAYWANIPNPDEPLNIGDKVILTSVLTNYNSTAEMKNPAVEILERVVVHFDTTEVSVCDAVEIGEALNSGAESEDFFIVEGVVTMAKAANTTYNNQTFDFTCADNNKILEGYNVTFKDNEYCAVGDTVRILGRLTNYQGTKVEFNGGKAEVIGKAPITYIPQIVNATVAEAVAAGMELANGAYSLDTFVVVGYVDSIAAVYDEKYDNISFFMCDDMAKPTYDFEAYRVAGGADITVGAKVAVKSILQHYYKAATEDKAEINLVETVAKGTYEILAGAALEDILTGKDAEKFIIDGQLYIRKNGVVYTVLGAKK